MIYVISDIHGEYGKYMEMLEKIKFSDEDTLFVLGDVVDRGPEPIRLLEDMSARENVILLKGNHELMALNVLRKLNVEITKENADTHLDNETLHALMDWIRNGGRITLQGFKQLPREKRNDMLDYLADTLAYEIVETNEKNFLLVHAGLGNYRPEKNLEEYTLEELLFARPDYQRQYFSNSDMYMVCGHTPTRFVTGMDEIYHSANNILIDCGAVYGGRLACLCLDTMQEFYV
jgi:serine/threonine protein phosphatase 1